LVAEGKEGRLDLSNIDWQGLLKNPIVWAVAGGLLLLVIIVAVVKSRGGTKMKTSVVDNTKMRARAKLKNDVKKASALAAPVFRKIDSEAAQAQAIGFWRKKLNHRIAIRAPDLNTLKGVARTLGQDAGPISDLDVSWKKMERQIGEYNSGKMDADKTPIATIRQFEKDLDKVVILVNMCMTKYGA